MSPKLQRVTGGFTLVSAILGIALALSGLVGVLQVRQSIVTGSDSLLTNLQLVVTDVVIALSVATEATTAASESLSSVQDALAAVNRTLTQASSLADSTGRLLNDELPSTLIATRTSLISAQGTARVVEDTLMVITSIPFLPVQRYQPDVPLHISLGELADELEPLPDTLIEIGDELQATGTDLIETRAALAQLRADLGAIRRSLVDVQTINAQTQTDLTKLLDDLANLQTALPSYINGIAIALIILLIWLLLNQIAALLQAWPMLPILLARFSPTAPIDTNAMGEIGAAPAEENGEPPTVTDNDGDAPSVAPDETDAPNPK